MRRSRHFGGFFVILGEYGMKSVQITNNHFDALICLNSKLPKKSFFEALVGLSIIAADGAALRLKKKNVIPNYIVGDLDSFLAVATEKDFPRSHIIHIAEQETNDFEKALKFAEEKNFRNLLICGIHGGELEHTLNNISVFLKYSGKLNLCIYDKFRYGFVCKESFILHCKKNDTLSLIPQPKIKLKTSMLKWELNSEYLEMGIREGARNVALSGQVTFEILEGQMLLFIPARIPYSPDFI